MKTALLYLLSSCVLVGAFAGSAMAEVRIFSKCISASEIKVKTIDPRSWMVTCDASTHSRTPLGNDAWHRYAQVSKMIINVPGDIIYPNPEVNCTIT